MNRTYKIGNHKVNEDELEYIYLSLDELRGEYVHDQYYYVSLTYCMEEVAKRSKRLKALAEKAERINYETGN